MGDFCERRYFSSVLILFVWTYSSPSQQHWVAPSWSTQRLVWSLQTSRTSQLWTSYFWPELNTQRHQLDNPLQTKGVVMLYILRRIKFLVFPKYLNLRISDTLLKGKFPLKTSKHQQSFPKILTTPIPSLLYFSVRIYKETCCTDYWPCDGGCQTVSIIRHSTLRSSPVKTSTSIRLSFSTDDLTVVALLALNWLIKEKKLILISSKDHSLPLARWSTTTLMTTVR